MFAPEPKWFSEAICKIEQNPDTFFDNGLTVPRPVTTTL